jgi:hypothetical protein
MNNSTYRRRSPTVAKSPARIAPGLLAPERAPGRACRPRAGSSPRRRSVARIAVAETRRPSVGVLLGCAGSPSGGSPWPADDQRLQVLVERGAAWSTMRVGPGAGDQTAMPAQQRVRPDEEARPARSRQHATDGGEQGPVGRLRPGTWELATQHGELVAHDEDLQILGSIAAAQ